MVKIQDRMGQLVGGLFRVSIEDKQDKKQTIDFELKPTEGHKRTLLFNYKKIQEMTQRYTTLLEKNQVTEEFMDNHNKKSDALQTEQNEVIKEVLKNSYPTWKENELSAVMMNYDTELLAELYMCWGWIDKDVIEAMKKKKLEEIKKLGGEEEEPQKKPQETPLK